MVMVVEELGVDMKDLKAEVVVVVVVEMEDLVVVLEQATYDHALKGGVPEGLVEVVAKVEGEERTKLGDDVGVLRLNLVEVDALFCDLRLLFVVFGLARIVEETGNGLDDCLGM